jgi:hypothetical protein
MSPPISIIVASLRHSRESGNLELATLQQFAPVQTKGRLWTPAFPTGQARGLKAHGVTITYWKLRIHFKSGSNPSPSMGEGGEGVMGSKIRAG